MKPNPDDRSDNVERIQENIDNTLYNAELAEEIIANTPDLKVKRELQAKNQRRGTALDSKRKEIKDESNAKNNK